MTSRISQFLSSMVESPIASRMIAVIAPIAVLTTLLWYDDSVVLLLLLGTAFVSGTLALVAVPLPQVAARRAEPREWTATQSRHEIVEVSTATTATIAVFAGAAMLALLLGILNGHSRWIPGAAAAAPFCALSIAISLSGNVASLHTCRLGPRAASCVAAVSVGSGVAAFAAASAILGADAMPSVPQLALILTVPATVSAVLVILTGSVLVRRRETPDLTLAPASSGLLQDTLSTWFLIDFFFVLPAWIDARIDLDSVQDPLEIWLPATTLLLGAAAIAVWGLGNSFGHLALEAERRAPEPLEAERLFRLERHLVRQALVFGCGLAAGLALAIIGVLT